jgi:hypothetical protein
VPDFRATIRSASLRLVDWAPYLARSGPLQTLIHARGRAGTGIADLTVVRDDELADELIVEFLTGDSPRHRDTLAAWAARVGYRRVWFPGDVLALPGAAAGGAATTTCTGCRARLTDADPAFWLSVRRTGRFPAVCPLCGCDLPQWSTMSDRGLPERPISRGKARRGAAEAVRRPP